MEIEKEYYENGNVRTEKVYENGILKTIHVYYPNVVIKSTREYNNGSLTKWYMYYEDGSLHCDMTYNKNKRHGMQYMYFGENTKVLHGKYEYGKLIKMWYE